MTEWNRSQPFPVRLDHTIDRQIDRYADRQTDRQTDRQIDRSIYSCIVVLFIPGHGE